MADYISIKGVKVQSLTADTAVEGQVWYRSDTGDLKFYNGSTVKTVTVS
tara:strand:- start:43 stop:189 length:147 start_codon:yes stop_codon:yes gene_type:complete